MRVRWVEAKVYNFSVRFNLVRFRFSEGFEIVRWLECKNTQEVLIWVSLSVDLSHRELLVTSDPLNPNIGLGTVQLNKNIFKLV